MLVGVFPGMSGAAVRVQDPKGTGTGSIFWLV